jgi:NAD-dependent DNA ligase
VTRKTSFLVVGADPGGEKLAKAGTLGTPQLAEPDFLRMLGRHDVRD